VAKRLDNLETNSLGTPLHLGIISHTMVKLLLKLLEEHLTPHLTLSHPSHPPPSPSKGPFTGGRGPWPAAAALGGGRWGWTRGVQLLGGGCPTPWCPWGVAWVSLEGPTMWE
jgi:hypothetical protein